MIYKYVPFFSLLELNLSLGDIFFSQYENRFTCICTSISHWLTFFFFFFLNLYIEIIRFRLFVKHEYLTL